MKLCELLEGIAPLAFSGSKDVAISGISYDSRYTKPGNLFVAIQGEKHDGHKFIESAVKTNGAVAVLYEKDMPEYANLLAVATFIKVHSSRKALAMIANNWYHKPSEGMTVIGITGTNGKTTTSYILKSILETWGKKAALIGTIQYMIADNIYKATHTTPESLEFQALLHDMRASGCSHVVTEVSSHALSQHRVDGTAFSCAVFTNLTRDHLDFHGTMEEYFSSKQRLFKELLRRKAYSVINHDDIWGRRLAESISDKIMTYGLDSDADMVATEINSTFEGLRFRILAEGTAHEVSSGFVGLTNIYNILAAAGAAVSIGVPWEAIIEGIRRTPQVKGRFEKVDIGQKFLAVVDYAHTEDALERLILTARGLTKGRIITVFGCGGDRDRGKRPKMGAVATKLSDLVIITSDNPRSERPADIIKEIESGASRRNYLIEPDRREAIRRAVLMAEEDDVLLVAGKGHETYQEISGERLQFNDREVLEESLKHLLNNA